MVLLSMSVHMCIFSSFSFSFSQTPSLQYLQLIRNTQSIHKCNCTILKGKNQTVIIRRAVLQSWVFTFTCPLTIGVLETPQMTLQPVSSIFLSSPLPSGTWQTTGLSIPWCCLPTPFSVYPVFFPLSLCLARWTCPYHFSLSLYDGQEVFKWSDCLLDLGTDVPVGNMVFAWAA